MPVYIPKIHCINFLQKSVKFETKKILQYQVKEI